MTVWPVYPRNDTERLELVDWASRELKVGLGSNALALGVRDETQPLAVVVYNNFRVDGAGKIFAAEASIASISPRWAARPVLHALFHYPFVVMRFRRLVTVCQASNGHVVRFNRRLGFVQEGVLRDGWDEGGDAILFAMLSHEAKYLRKDDHATLAA